MILAKFNLFELFVTTEVASWICSACTRQYVCRAGLVIRGANDHVSRQTFKLETDMATVQLAQTAADERLAVSEKLTQVLAETFVETVKAQTYHWNVTGMAFGPLHALFQEIYEDHFATQDELAERVRALGLAIDGRIAAMAERSTIADCQGNIPAHVMIENLAEDQRRLSQSMQDLARIAEEKGDMVTNDMAIERANIHDKFAWMLSAHLADV